MEEAGQKLKRARERLNLRYRDVEEASNQIAARHSNDEFSIALSRLADIENKGTVPTIYRLYALCAIYRLDFNEVLDDVFEVVTRRELGYRGAITRATCRLAVTRLMELAANRDADPQVRAEATEGLVVVRLDRRVVAEQLLEPRAGVQTDVVLREGAGRLLVQVPQRWVSYRDRFPRSRRQACGTTSRGCRKPSLNARPIFASISRCRHGRRGSWFGMRNAAHASARRAKSAGTAPAPASVPMPNASPFRAPSCSPAGAAMIRRHALSRAASA